VSFSIASMVEITNEDWELYENRFGSLINFIAHRITGDPSNCCIEDNVQDLNMAALASIEGYYAKNKCYDKPFSEIVDTRLFASYTKTCLWNRKNNKGVKASRHKETFVPVEEYYE